MLEKQVTNEYKRAQALLYSGSQLSSNRSFFVRSHCHTIVRKLSYTLEFRRGLPLIFRRSSPRLLQGSADTTTAAFRRRTTAPARRSRCLHPRTVTFRRLAMPSDRSCRQRSESCRQRRPGEIAAANHQRFLGQTAHRDVKME